MLDIFTEYATDEAREENGTWFEVGDARLLIARINNKKYSRKMARAYDRNRKLLDRKDDAADALAEKIMCETLADSILLGWENLAFSGETFPYNRENAIKALGFKDFRKLVMDLAGDEAEFKLVREAEEGND